MMCLHAHSNPPLDVARENKQANTPFQPLDGSVLPAGVLVGAVWRAGGGAGGGCV